ncbi:MAG: 2-dehydro-3-deoxygalactonokinase [Terricaulis sp.]
MRSPPRSSPRPARFQAWLTPGLSVAHENGLFDVMRGEETQIFGALTDARPPSSSRPGTHSKWARVEDACVADHPHAHDGRNVRAA